MRLSELLPKSLIEPTLPAITGDPVVTGLSEDSRKIRAGHLFFAIAGTKSDGRQFCQHAVDAGAIAVITDNRDLDDELDALLARFDVDGDGSVRLIHLDECRVQFNRDPHS